MAHFAQIKNGLVSTVIVVNNDVLLDAQGIEQENIGIEFCKSLYGADTEWVQTSYSGSFRGVFASVGMVFDAENDEFTLPQPYSE